MAFKYSFTFLALLFFGFGTHHSYNRAQAQERVASPRELLLKHNSLLSEANTHEDWHRIELENKRLTHRVFHSEIYTETELCSSLKSLPAPDLISHYSSILESQRLLSCQKDLLSRIERHLQFEKLHLMTDIQMKALPELNVCDESKLDRPLLGPTQEKILDVKNKKTVIDAELKRCHIALTFDDGPHPALTPKLIESLDKENVLANFFVLGNNTKNHPSVIHALDSRGHIVGNHTLSHQNLRRLSHSEALAEIYKGFSAIVDTLGYATPFFRFPFGNSTPLLKNELYQDDILDFFWNMDTLDWKIKNTTELYRHVLLQIEQKQRGIILFHDIQPQTINVIPFVLSALKKAGYTTILLKPNE